MTFRWLRSNNKEKQTSEWSTKDVQRFFREQHLEEVAVAAKKAKLCGKQLLRHEPSEAKELAQLYAMLGVTRLGQKKKLRSALIHLRQQSLSEDKTPKADFSLSDTTITKVSSSTWSPVVPSRRVRSGSGSSFGTPCASGESTPSSYHTPQSSPPSTPVRLRSLSDAADLAQRLDDVTNLSEASAFLHRNSVVTVKAALRRRATHNKSVVAYDEVDVSLLRLDVGSGSRQLQYADLVEEVARVHGSVATKKMKIRYTDGEGDEVTILGDDALRYAFRDWRQRVQATPPGRLAPSWRLCLDGDDEDEGHHLSNYDEDVPILPCK
ncbi:uncharacterized protein ACA1_077770 [Acanthamoeba castellanii str. Neff]|uniref:SAM domain-containing protein n=1 Tax=Acanthamoeba castellanii (strain ATCC 30010 / Neff) TaxID=1257118 RepID=L8GQZ1_ACACF|nr:uncharacterized protein ACA1_077770 [Acanthamoeba castellanii str. Neff]ELR14546.1 hypothetical protein ACA1_077770 [Acanthamoeba castellanii str. Neff]